MTEHQTKCPAPICADCKDETTVWYIGEPVCKKAPLSMVQKRQNAANKHLKTHTMKNIDVPYTALYLKHHTI